MKSFIIFLVALMIGLLFAYFAFAEPTRPKYDSQWRQSLFSARCLPGKKFCPELQECRLLRARILRDLQVAHNEEPDNEFTRLNFAFHCEGED